MDRYNLSNTHIKIYYETCSEFEEVRNEILAEGNWLGANYTKEKLVIEHHKGFGVVYQTSTGKPMVMGGVYHDDRYPSNVANIVHRGFTFPEFRMTPRDMTDGFRVTYSLMRALEAVNTFDGYILTMQNRDKKDCKGWWDRVFVKHMLIASDGNYVNGGGYIQTAPWNVQKCWQNFVYHEKVPGVITEQWNPKLITHNEWSELDPGL
jgi:hypothetical protein